MRFEMKMPDLSTNELDVRIVRWLIEPGQAIERGRPLLEVETDKATMEVESAVSGVLQEVRSQVNEAVSVGQVIAVLDVEGTGPTAVSAAATSPCREQSADGVPLLRRSSGEGPPSPGTDCGQAVAHEAGTGMFARNRAAIAALPATSAVGIPLSVAQRVAAKRLQESKQTIPHFYLQTSANASAIVARRTAAESVKLAWDAFLVLAVAKAIGRFDRFRCRLEGERLVTADIDAIGVATDHAGELYVIPIAGAAAKSVEQISAEIRGNVERLRGGDAEMRKIRPALMTVTNLGVCNVESFVPIINPPEAAILGVGKVLLQSVVQADGRIGVEPRCTLTLSVDHRIVSGKYAGDFLGAIVKELESF
jgi:pyruvate dehydrogenase E2 component (dihydrolipoamide acetyltransferase)